MSWASNAPFIPRQGHGDADSSVVGAAAASRPAWRRRMVLTLLVGDGALGVVVALLASATLNMRPHMAAVVVVAAGLGWVLGMALTRGYDVRRTGSGPDELQAVMRAALGLGTAAGLLSYAFGLNLPRRYVFIALPALALLTALWRYLIRRRLHARRQRKQDVFRTLVVGPRAAVADVSERLEKEPHYGYHVIGACLPSYARDRRDLSAPLLGAISDVPQVAVDHDVDVVLVVGDHLSGAPLRRLSWALERTQADLVVSPGLVEVLGPRVAVRPTAGLSLLHLEASSRNLRRRLGKDVLDRALGSALLAAAAIPLLLAMLAVACTSRGPIIYRHTRIGRDGVPFRMYKLRSMVADADASRDALLSRSDRDGLMFKMRADPRVTTVGRWLRRFSIDELPQLINVVRGEMSLVGPRPPLPREVDGYHDFVNRRLRVRPGLTGLWQVSGRADLSWDESVRLDLRYVDNWSIAMDFLILWKTARAVLKGSGAY